MLERFTDPIVVAGSRRERARALSMRGHQVIRDGVVVASCDTAARSLSLRRAYGCGSPRVTDRWPGFGGRSQRSRLASTALFPCDAA
jgi:hypothetical protein